MYHMGAVQAHQWFFKSRDLRKIDFQSECEKESVSREIFDRFRSP